MRHLTGSVYGIFKQPVPMHKGTTMAGIIRDEARHDTKRGFVGGYELETPSPGVPFMAAFLNPGQASMCEFFVKADPIQYEQRSRTVRIQGVLTSIRLENMVWNVLAEMAEDEDRTTNALVSMRRGRQAPEVLKPAVLRSAQS